MRIGVQMPPVAEPDLLEAAARTLDAVPGAEAELLYGSRARGGAVTESDQDIAVVTKKEFPAPSSAGELRSRPFNRVSTPSSRILTS